MMTRSCRASLAGFAARSTTGSKTCAGMVVHDTWVCDSACEFVWARANSVCAPLGFTDARTQSPLYRGDGDDASWFSCLRRVGRSIKELFDEVLLGQKYAEGE
jgi:hypothetical protein